MNIYFRPLYFYSIPTYKKYHLTLNSTFKLHIRLPYICPPPYKKSYPLCRRSFLTCAGPFPPCRTSFLFFEGPCLPYAGPCLISCRILAQRYPFCGCLQIVAIPRKWFIAYTYVLCTNCKYKCSLK